MKDIAENGSFAERIKAGLEECLRHVRGEITLPIKVLEAPSSSPNYSAQELTRLRKRAHLSPEQLARLVGVSAKSVRSWESGASSPSTKARGMLQLVQESPDIMYRLALGKEEEEQERKERQAKSRRPKRPVKNGRAVAMTIRGKSPAKVAQKLRTR